MTKARPAVTEPVSIVVAEGVVLRTAIDPLTKKHQVHMFISRQEEMWMGISERATFEYRDDFELPGSDDIEVIKADVVKRERAETLPVCGGAERKEKEKLKGVYIFIS